MIISKDEADSKDNIDWTALVTATANFTTQILYLDSNRQIRSKRTIFFILFASAFFLVGTWLLFFITLGDPVYRQGGAIFSDAGLWGDVFSLLLSLAFVLGSMHMLLCGQEILVEGNNGSIDIVNVFFFKADKRTIVLEDVEALQLLGHLSGSGDDSYWAYELNAVLYDSSRVNILAHGGERRMIKDAQLLSDFVLKPLLSNLA